MRMRPLNARLHYVLLQLINAVFLLLTVTEADTQPRLLLTCS